MTVTPVGAAGPPEGDEDDEEQARRATKPRKSERRSHIRGNVAED